MLKVVAKMQPQMAEDDVYVVGGMPPLQPIPNVSAGKLIYKHLTENSNETEVLIDTLTGQSISNKTLLSKTCSLAESLRRCGYNESTMTTICSENCVEFFIPIIATLYMGATIAPVSHYYTQSEIVHALNIAKPKIIFCSKQVYPKFVDLRKKLDYIERVLIIDSDGKHEESIEVFIGRYLLTPSNRFDVADVDINQNVALILYSSGTTGLPKGVMITQKNILVRFLQNDDPRLGIKEEGPTLGLLPFFHAYGLIVGLCAIYSSAQIIVIKKFEEKVFLSSIEKYRISTLVLVPPLAILLSKSPLVNAYDLSCVKSVICGAASLSKNTEELLKKRLKLDSVKQGYGLTECTIGVTGLPLNVQRSGSSGKVLPYVLCKIRDPKSGKSLGPNHVGELCVKGEIVMKGYYGNEEATRNTLTRDGWLLTGDLGYYDEEEYFYIVGRLKELIKYKGLQVAPAELEAVLLTHPKIKDAAVIGVPDEEAGELPMAFVVLHPGLDLTELEVEEFVAKRVSPQKKLRGGVRFIAEVPKNPSGKILRLKLQNLANYIRSHL